MKKKGIIILIILAAVMLASLGYYYFNKYSSSKNYSAQVNSSKYKRPPLELMTEEEKDSLNLYHYGVYEVVTRDANHKPTAYNFIRLKEADAITLELMTDSEREALKIPAGLKVQVLKRDANGKISSYHIIKSDSDIITKY